ncbi:MAG: HNH endonuclease [Gemmataceae bacterium]|nr:HNH endonuclease [Gemmataceae bacterium]
MDTESLRRLSAFPTGTNYVGGPLNVMAGVPRSPKWPAFRRRHLKRQPICQACGCDVPAMLAVHHIKPFHLFPELELDAGNVITLCERGAFNCHWIFGHVKSWSHWNPRVVEHAAIYRDMIAGVRDTREEG